MLLVTLSLVACHKHVTYKSLFLNHDATTKLYDDCQMGDEAKKQSRDCQMVFNVMANFNTIYNEAVTNGEYLGQHLLELQADLKSSEKEYKTKQQALVDLQKTNANAAEVQQATTALDELKKSNFQKHDEIKFILAVIGLAESPD